MSSEAESLSQVSVDIPWKRYRIAAFAGIAASIVRNIPNSRNHIPEPFDFFDHVGNVNVSAPAGAALGFVAGAFYSSRSETQKESKLRRKARAAITAGGLLAGVLVNTVSETKWGMSITHVGTTGDVVDFAYGVIASVVAANLATTIEATVADESAYDHTAQPSD